MTSLRSGSREPLSRRYDAALLDLDGVVYLGNDAIPGAATGVHGAREDGMRVVFVTNNASRTPEAVAAHLASMDVSATADDVVTSAQAAARLVSELVPAGAPVLLVGGEGLAAALAERGLQAVHSADDGPAAVIQGFAPEVGWQQLAEGTFAVRTGLPWVASNVDLTLPTDRGAAPGNGTLVGVIAAATGRRPTVAGKPEPALHEEAVRRSGAGSPVVVGDRLDTDIEGAVRADVDSLLVLTGVCRPVDAVLAPATQRPTYVAEDLEQGLLRPHPEVVDSQSGYSCGGWTVSGSDTGWRLDGSGERIDALRALCVAEWSREPGPSDPGRDRAEVEGLVEAAGWREPSNA